MIKNRTGPIAFGVGVLAVTLALSQTAFAQPGSQPSWRVAFSHHYGGPATSAQYFAIASDGQRAAWAVGGAGQDLSGWPVAAHWTGKKWFASALPRGLTSNLIAVSVDSAKDAWAPSFLGGYVLHWTGSRWFVAKRFPEHGLATEITGVPAFSPTTVWVFGGSGAFPGVGTWHLHGTTWTRVHGFGDNISFASALSPANIWGVGGINAGQDSIMHYIGGHWRHIVAKPLAGKMFRGIVATPGGQVWVSASPVANAFKPYVLHLSGGRWRALAVPFPANIGPIALDGHGGIWLTGGTSSGSVDAIHLTASGRWSMIRVGANATRSLGLSWISGTGSLWGAGAMLTKSGQDAAVWAHGPVG